MHCSSALGVPFEDCRIGVTASSIRLQCLHAWVGPTFEMFKIAAHLYEVSKKTLLYKDQVFLTNPPR